MNALTPVLVACVLFAATAAGAGVIPAARTVDWSVAGYPGEVPRPATIVNAKDHGATGDGSTNDQPAIVAAIAALKGAPGVVYLPAGNYRITAGFSLPSGTVLRGESSAASWIRCDLPNSGSTCISIGGTTSGAWRNALDGLAKGSTALTVADATGFVAGDWAEIRETNGSWDVKPADWAKNVVGQMLRVTAVDGNVLTIEYPLRTDFDAALAPQVIRVVPKVDVGIEDLGIERVADPTGSGGGSNVQFSYAARCWMQGVESNKSVGSHVGVYTSTQLEITGSYFHHGFTYDGTSTRGYGVTLNSHSGECLIENNVFNHLRHAMMVKTGANGNVFAYNYSRDPYRSETINDFPGDISVHGHWPVANLFEGNIVGNIMTDQTWGPAGPYNTMFRNRAEWYGICVSYDAPSNDQNVVGNDILGGKSNIVFDALYGLPYGIKGSGHFEHGNDVEGAIKPSGTGTLADVSYYRDPASDFCELAPGWPSIGVPNALGAGTIRARQRWDAGGVMTYDPLRVSAGIDATIAVGEAVTLAGEAGGGRGTRTIAWTPEEGLDDPHAPAPVARPDRSTTYTLIVTDANGCTRSDSTRVTVTGTVATPVLSPEPGPYGTPVAVTLSCPTPHATVRFTLDGSPPEATSTEATGPIALDLPGTVTLRARAFREDWLDSEEAAGTYVLTDADECADGTDDCDANAACANAWPGWTCTCLAGFAGDGWTCADVDECGRGLHDCAAEATCTNEPGAWWCACRPGFVGDGRACLDVDECAAGTAACDSNAACANTIGAYACTCKAGFEGDGTAGHCTPVCGDDRVVDGEPCDDGNDDDGDACSNACTVNPEGDGCGTAVTLAPGAPWEGTLAGTHASEALSETCAPTGTVAGPDAFAEVTVTAGATYAFTLVPRAGDRLGLAVQRSCAADDCDHGATVAATAGDTVTDEVRAGADGTLRVRVFAPDGPAGAFLLEVVEIATGPDDAGTAGDAGPDAGDEAAVDAGTDPGPGSDPGDDSIAPAEDPGSDVPVDAPEARDDGTADATDPVGDAAGDLAPDVVGDLPGDIAADPASDVPQAPDLSDPEATTEDVPSFDPGAAPDASADEGGPAHDVPTPEDPGPLSPDTPGPDTGPPPSRRGGGCAATRPGSDPAGPGAILLALAALAIGRTAFRRRVGEPSPGTRP